MVDGTIIRVDNKRAAWRKVSDELVVLDLDTSSYLSVNECGTSLWPLLESGASRQAMVDLLLAEYEVERPMAEQDVDAFLAALDERGLLVTDA